MGRPLGRPTLRLLQDADGLNRIYAPPEADISVDVPASELTFLKSLGGFILSLFVVIAVAVADIVALTAIKTA